MSNGGGYKFTSADLIKLIETPHEKIEEALKNLGGTEGVAAGIGTSLTYGLDTSRTDDMAKRETVFGKNYIAPPKPASILELMWEAFHDTTIIVLSLSGLLSLILGATMEGLSAEWIEGASILLAVLLVTGVTAVNNWQKEKQFAALNAVKEDEKIKVLRNGVPCEVSKFHLLVGDVLRVDLGDILPADGIIFDESEIKIDESTLTGESDLLKKTRVEAPVMYSGTRVMEGVAKMLVLCVGVNSQAGIISSLVQGKGAHEADDKKKKGKIKESAVGPVNDVEIKKKNESDEVYEQESESPLQGKLNKLTMKIAKAGTSVAIIVFLAMTIRFSIETFGKGKNEWNKSYATDYLHFFITSITVLVVSIPEGLPLAVTISLAFSVKKMLLDNNLVRHLDACETMGSATTICSDKTGTLTTNRMTVMQCWIGGREYSAASQLLGEISDSLREAFGHGVALNSTAEILPPKVPGGQFEHTGNKTECALLSFCKELGVDYADVRKSNPIGHMLTFSSKKKRMSVVAARGVNSRVYCKGATEVVLGLCNKVKRLDGSVADLTESEKEVIGRDIIEKFASQGYRTLCLAIRDLDISTDQVKTWSDDDIETDLTCVAIVGIEDPVRPEVPDAIRQCHRAGIVVRMVTGDNITTARSIAAKCGILKPNDGAITMEGAEFRSRVLDKDGKIIQSEFDKIWPMLRVLARSSPKDKYTLVTGLKQTNLMPYGPQVVAVTGDGTNDAPALKKANVGFAMGICGTAVAKEACDIILMDDNFTSIVNAVKWGRNVYDSISKFLQFQLTVNLVAITLAVLGAVAIEESPLSAIQLLWVNLIMDTFASLSLATEKPTQALLERKPYPRTQPLLSPMMLKHLIGQAIFQLVVLIILLFMGEKIFDIPSGRLWDKPPEKKNDASEHYTIIFNTFVFMQLFNELNCRKIHDEINIFEGLLDSALFFNISIFQVACQVLIVQFGGRPFSCVDLSVSHWLFCIGVGALSLPLGLILRMSPTPSFLGKE